MCVVILAVSYQFNIFVFAYEIKIPYSNFFYKL